jgi:di/tricarboxylate transporter
VALVEAVLAPNSAYGGKTPDDLQFRDTFGGSILAIRHRGELLHEHLAATRLRPGDALLVEVSRRDLPRFRRDRGFVVVSELRHAEAHSRRAFLAAAIVAAVIAAVALGALPMVNAALIGCVLMVVTRCLRPEETYAAVEWRVIVLLAGVLSLGTALEKTGAAHLVAELLLSVVGPWGPMVAVSILYLVTSLLTEVMSNVAAAALLAPIAIVSAESLGCDSRPLLMAVTFAASASFMTPVGYQTNTLVYGPGGYRFSDFVRVGAPLNLIVWILATLLIPRFWPF